MKNISIQQGRALAALLNTYFFNRTDVVGAMSPSGNCGPIAGVANLNDLLMAHVMGELVSPAAVNFMAKNEVAKSETDWPRIGSYAPNKENKTRWICVDFDGGDGHTDPLLDPRAAALALYLKCRELNLPAYLEKSGSGEGWHVWIFFGEPVAAVDARRLGKAVIAAGFKTKSGKDSSEAVEVFPKSDKLKNENGLGNFIWLPWWHAAPEGANQFYKLVEGELVEYMPDNFETITKEALANAIDSLPKDNAKPAMIIRQTVRNDSKDEERIRDALRAIDPTPYDDWLKIGMAIHSWDSGARGFAIFDEWSKTASNYGETGEKWKSFSPQGGVRLGTLFAIAKQSGWTPKKNLPGLPAQSSSSIGFDEILKAAGLGQTGDAELFAKLEKDRAAFDHSAGRWFLFGPKHWREDCTKEIQTELNKLSDLYIKASKEAYDREITAISKGAAGVAEVKKAIYERSIVQKKLAKLCNASWRRDVLELATSDGYGLALRGDEWDAKPMSLPVLNGIVDLETGVLRNGKPSDYVKTFAPTSFEGLNAPCPIWNSALNDIFNGDAASIEYLQRFMGYSVGGSNQEHLFAVFHGVGRNGKTLILETIGRILGPLAGPIKSETLLKQSHTASADAADPAIMALRGKRIAWASETEESRTLNSGRVKWLTGGDTLTGRALYARATVTFKPTYTLILCTNHKPVCDANDFALWQQICLFPFGISFVSNPSAPNERKADPRLSEKLLAEAPGILAWLVRGCMAWRQNGLNRPPAVGAATDEYRSEQDVVGQFIAERCEVGNAPQFRAGGGELYKAFQGWCWEKGITPTNNNKFGESVKSRFDKRLEHNKAIYLGVRLSDSGSPGEPGEPISSNFPLNKS